MGNIKFLLARCSNKNSENLWNVKIEKKYIMDKITQRLLGIAAIIFAFAFLIRSFSPAQANHAPQTTYGTGKYMMEMTSIINSNDLVTWYILVWNTESGNSKLYYGTVATGNQSANGEYQLPSSPL